MFISVTLKRPSLGVIRDWQYPLKSIYMSSQGDKDLNLSPRLYRYSLGHVHVMISMIFHYLSSFNILKQVCRHTVGSKNLKVITTIENDYLGTQSWAEIILS